MLPIPVLATGQEASVLAARVRELEMEKRLMQRDLDAMTELCTRTDSQLRCGRVKLHLDLSQLDKAAGLTKHVEP